jgi:signal transduction histidine kinase
MSSSQRIHQPQIRRSIHIQLLMLVLAVALPLLSLALFGIYRIVSKEIEQAYDLATDLAQLTAANVESLFTDSENTLAQIAQRPLVQAMAPDQCDPFLHEVASLLPYSAGLRITDNSGQIICASERSDNAPLPSVADREWFQEISRSHSFTVGDAQIGRIVSTWIVVLAYPILDEQGNFIGVVSMPIDLLRFQAGLNVEITEAGSSITILDRKGTLVARSFDPQQWVGRQLRNDDIVERVLALGEGNARAYGVDGIERLYGFTTLDRTGWYVYVGIPVENALGAARRTALYMGLLLLGSIVFVALTSTHLKRQIEQPTHALASIAAEVAMGRFDQRAPLTGPLEFVEVATQFNHMLDTQAKNAAQLKHRAHQLQALGQMGQAVASSLSLPVLLTHVLDHVELLVPAELISIWVNEAGTLQQVAQRGMESTGQSHRQLPLNSILIDKVVRQGHSITIEDIDQETGSDDPFLQWVRRSYPSVGAIQIVPLTLQGKTMGMLQVMHQKPATLRSDDLQLLEAAASWTSIAISNARQYNQLRLLANQVISAHEEERKRVARILHDGVQQLLYAVQMRSHLIHLDLPPPSEAGVRQSLDELQRLIEDAIEATRTLAHELSPPILETTDLTDLLQWQADRMQALHGLHTTVTVETPLQIEDKERRILLFQTIRELIFNVVKHAGTPEAEITAAQRNGSVHVTVRDKGEGFDPHSLSLSSNLSGMGLSSIRERLRLFGGEMSLHSAPGEGTEVTISLP